MVKRERLNYPKVAAYVSRRNQAKRSSSPVPRRLHLRRSLPSSSAQLCDALAEHVLDFPPPGDGWRVLPAGKVQRGDMRPHLGQHLSHPRDILPMLDPPDPARSQRVTGLVLLKSLNHFWNQRSANRLPASPFYISAPP